MGWSELESTESVKSNPQNSKAICALELSLGNIFFKKISLKHSALFRVHLCFLFYHWNCWPSIHLNLYSNFPCVRSSRINRISQSNTSFCFIILFWVFLYFISLLFHQLNNALKNIQLAITYLKMLSYTSQLPYSQITFNFFQSMYNYAKLSSFYFPIFCLPLFGI